MGHMTYEEMRNEVSLNLGGDAPAPTRLSTWINWALQDLSSMEGLDFEELLGTQELVITEGDYEYSLPTNILGIRTVSLSSEGFERKLLRMNREFDRLEDASGTPTHYMRRGSSLVLWPTPDTSYVGVIEGVIAEAKVTDFSQVSPFPPQWDAAIVHLATYHGLMALGQEEKAATRLAMVDRYIRTRQTPKYLEKDSLRAGLDVAWDSYDITNRIP